MNCKAKYPENTGVNMSEWRELKVKSGPGRIRTFNQADKGFIPTQL